MKHITRLDIDHNAIDYDDPVMKMKRKDREMRTTSPRAVRTEENKELWDEHHAQIAGLRHASSKQDLERMTNRKMRLGDRNVVPESSDQGEHAV